MFIPIRKLRFLFFHALAAVVALHAAMTIGCGDSGPTDSDQVNVAIANLSEAALERESFESFFVAGSAPGESERPRYRGYFYEMDPPKVTGDTATARVRILDADGDLVGEKDWLFSRVDDQWKISTAPLP